MDRNQFGYTKLVRLITKSLGREVSTREGSSEQLKLGVDTDIRYAEITAEGSNIVGDYTKISGRVELGYATTIGRSNHIFGGEIRIGRYCQFGPCVGIYAMDHPITHMTTYLNQQLFGGRLKKHQEQGTVSIGSDVWIGHGAIVLPNVVIGDGAVVGAGALVTRHVEDFSVVVGNPARELKKRFNGEIVSLLKLVRWWDLSTDELNEIEDLFHIDFVANPVQAADRLHQYLSQLKPARKVG